MTVALAEQVARSLQIQSYTLATAESCTGGGIAKLLTDLPGSSAWFERGFVTYSNAAKRECLQVPETTLAHYGAVSKETVAAMAQGALQQSHANVALAVSGVAGPGGGSAEKPVGLVWLAWARVDGTLHCQQHFFQGDRSSVREQAVEAALEGLLDVLKR